MLAAMTTQESMPSQAAEADSQLPSPIRHFIDEEVPTPIESQETKSQMAESIPRLT